MTARSSQSTTWLLDASTKAWSGINAATRSCANLAFFSVAMGVTVLSGMPWSAAAPGVVNEISSSACWMP